MEDDGLQEEAANFVRRIERSLREEGEVFLLLNSFRKRKEEDEIFSQGRESRDRKEESCLSSLKLLENAKGRTKVFSGGREEGQRMSGTEERMEK